MAQATLSSDFVGIHLVLQIATAQAGFSVSFGAIHLLCQHDTDNLFK